MKVDVEIKQITEKELDEFFEVFSRLLKTQFPEYAGNIATHMTSNPKMWSKKRYRILIKNRSNIVLGARIEDSLVGLIDADFPLGGVSFCTWIMVDPKSQRKGIGKELLRAWEHSVKERGGHFLFLYSDERNIPFYEKFGFKLSGKFEKAWFGETDYIMSKLIQEPKEENFLR